MVTKWIKPHPWPNFLGGELKNDGNTEHSVYKFVFYKFYFLWKLSFFYKKCCLKILPWSMNIFRDCSQRLRFFHIFNHLPTVLHLLQWQRRFLFRSRSNLSSILYILIGKEGNVSRPDFILQIFIFISKSWQLICIWKFAPTLLKS